MPTDLWNVGNLALTTVSCLFRQWEARYNNIFKSPIGKKTSLQFELLRVILLQNESNASDLNFSRTHVRPNQS